MKFPRLDLRLCLLGCVAAMLTAGGSVFAAPLVFADAGALLTALEDADADIDSLMSPIVYRKFFAIQSDTQTRSGTLWFETRRGEDPASAPQRRFAILFNSLIVADRQETMEQHYAFDGQWVVEKTPEDRQFTKRQVVPPGEDFDPLRIGEGPFPVPIGQRKADILARFTATLEPGTDGLNDPSLLSMAEQLGFVQLRLVPIPGTAESRDFEEIRIWYESTGSLLPRIARTVTPIGDESQVVLLKPEINTPIDESVFSTATPPPSEGWNVHVSEYREPTRGD